MSDTVAGWDLASGCARDIAATTAKNADSVKRNKVFIGLLRNPSVSEAEKAQVFLCLCQNTTAPLLVAPLALPRPVSAAALTKAALDSDSPTARMCLAVALDAGLFGLNKLSRKELREAADRLLSDSELSVRLLAARLFWKSSDSSVEAQKRLIAAFKDPNDRLDANRAVWEAGSLTSPVFDVGFITEPYADHSQEAILRNLLARAPADGDATPVLEEVATKFQERMGLNAAAIKVALAGPYPDTVKAQWVDRLNATAHYLDFESIMDSVLPFYLAHPETATSMPRLIAQIAAVGCRKNGNEVLDIPATAEKLTAPKTMPAAIEDILATTASPYLAKPFMSLSRGLREKAKQTILESLDATTCASYQTVFDIATAMAAGAPVSRLCAILVELAGARQPPALSLDWLLAAAALCNSPRLLRAELREVLTIVAEAFRQNVGYAGDGRTREQRDTYVSLLSRFVDPRLTPVDSAELIEHLLAGADPSIGQKAVRVWEQLGMPATTVRALNQAHELKLVSPATVAGASPHAPQSELAAMLQKTDRVSLLEAVLATEPPREGSFYDAVRDFLQEDPLAMLARCTRQGPGGDSARALLSELPSFDESQLLRFVTAPDFPTISAAEEAQVWQVCASKDELTIGALRFLAAVARGASYDALRDQFAATLPRLRFDLADKERALGEDAAMAALLALTGDMPYSLQQACLFAAALTTKAPSSARAEIISAGVRQYQGTTICTYAIDAISLFRGAEGFCEAMGAVTRLAELQQASSPASLEQETAQVAPLIVDERLPKEQAKRLLLTFVCATAPDRRNEYQTLTRLGVNGTRGTLALLTYALAHRQDWTAEDRALIEKAGHLLLEETLELTDHLKLTKRLVSAFEQAQSNESSGAAWGRGPQYNSARLMDLKNGYEAVLPLAKYSYELTGDPWETATSFWVHNPYDSSFFGPIPLPPA